MRPLLLRPPLLCNGSSSDRSGFLPGVSSSNVETLIPRRPGEVGRYTFSGISDSLEELDPLAGLERDDGLFPRSRHPIAAPHAALLAGDAHDVDGGDADLEDLLDRLLDLDLVYRRGHLEGV